METKNSSKSSKVTDIDLFQEEGTFVPIIVAYKVAEDLWRGFVQPYAETTEASSKKEVIKQMRDLTDAYRETIKRFDNPQHLVHPGLWDINDREVFSKIINNKEAMSQVLSSKGKIDTDSYYVETYRG